MAKKSDSDTAEEKHRLLAQRALDLFMPEDPEDDKDTELVALFATLDGVTGAAVAIQVCYELDPGEIAEFLAILEGTEPDEEEDGEEA